MSKTIILYGTETGTAEDLAEQLGELLSINSIPNQVVNMFDTDLKNLPDYDQILVIVSTWGEGEPPSDAEDLYEELKLAEPDLLKGKPFAVFGLGDSGYEQFCQSGKDFEKLFLAVGAIPICDRVDADIDFEDPFEDWSQQLLSLVPQCC